MTVPADDASREATHLPALRRPLPEDSTPARRLAARAGRHVTWLRRDGLGRMVEEDGLDPRDRARSAWESWRWRRTHPRPPGAARVAFIVGVQRSGTNMVLRGIEQDPSVEVRNENDKTTFDRFQLRDSRAVREVVSSSRHDLVLFKPLCDSHRTADLLAEFGTEQRPARAVWIYRGVDDRVRSAVRKFGDVNRQVLTEIAESGGGSRWQAQRLSPESLDLIRSVRPAQLSPESAAALFWLVRNRLYFEQGLHGRSDVHLVGYEQTTRDPEGEVGALAQFLGLAYSPRLVAHIDRRSDVRRPPLELEARIRAACTALEAQLAAASESSRRRVTGEAST